MATIRYNIVDGTGPFIVELIPSLLPNNFHNAPGIYSFENVPNGNYTVIVRDSNECAIETQVTVDPSINTSTTTVPLGDRMIIGQTVDEEFIFNVEGTNRDGHYSGYPDETQSKIYLWLRTLNGTPIVSNKLITYTISGNIGNNFKINNFSDEIHAEINEIISNSSTISGQILLKPGFIETFLQYDYTKNISSPNFQVNLSSNISWVYIDIPIVDVINQYGVTYVDNDSIIMKF